MSRALSAPGVIKTQRPITDPETGRPSDALAVPFPNAAKGKRRRNGHRASEG